MMSQPWQSPANYSVGQFNEGFQGQRERVHARGSLGQFIERSTSAPPPSSSAFFGAATDEKLHHNGSNLVGNDLLECVTLGYNDMSLHSHSVARSNTDRKGKIVEQNSGGESDDEFGEVWLDMGDSNNHNGSDFLRNSGTNGSGALSGSLGALGSSLSRPLSASGDGLTGMEARRSHLYGDLPLTLGSGMVRSQSAAPPSSSQMGLGPPPGLADLVDDSYSSGSSSKHQINQWGQGIRRPSSAGVLGGGGFGSSSAGAATLRPAAKTLMDLIQEDGTPEDLRPPSASGINNMRDTNNSLGSQKKAANSYVSDLGGGTVSPSSIQHLQSGNAVSQSLTPSPGISGYNAAQSPHYQLQHSMQPQLQVHDELGNGFRGGYYPQLSQQSYDGQQQMNQQGHLGQPQANPQSHIVQSHMNQLTHLAQPTLNQQNHMGQHELSIPMDQQHMALNHRQLGGMSNVGMIRQGIPNDEVLQNSPYSQVHQPPQPQSHQQPHQQNHQQPQQHIFYNGQRIEIPHGIQTQNMQSQGMQHAVHPQSMQGLNVQGIQATQTIQLPNGQTVYVSTAPPPQQSYGYSTVQYHSPSNQHPHIIQEPRHSGLANEGGQYVSVVSVQGGPPMTYWQPNGIPTQQAALGITNANGAAGPISISRVHPSGEITTSPLSQQQMHGNQYGGNVLRREKGGRGRRGAGTATGRRGSDAKVSGAALTSPLLEEFRISKSRDWTMRRIEGHVVEFCQDQNGSRFIQQRLEMGDISEQQIVMQEVLPAIRRLRNDVFGNYVVQKLLDFGTLKMKADIQSTLDGEMVQLSLQMYGCRVVQKALEALNEDDLPRLLHEFHHNVLSCIHDQNGNHVIQKCVEVLNSRANKAKQSGDVHRATFLVEQIDFIIDDVLVNTTTLSCHPYGCRVLQRILEHCSDEKKTKILDEIKRCHEKLLDDQYGNYVIQHVLQFGREEDRDSILGIVVKNGLLILSRQKFASNVVEKLLKYGNSHQRCTLVREMLKKADEITTPSEPSDGSASVVLLMVRDAYANYVVQTTLDVVPESDEKQRLLEELNSHVEELRNFTFAKHIVAKLSSLNGGS